jgi:hypothetical protein
MLFLFSGDIITLVEGMSAGEYHDEYHLTGCIIVIRRGRDRPTNQGADGVVTLVLGEVKLKHSREWKTTKARWRTRSIGGVRS